MTEKIDSTVGYFVAGLAIGSLIGSSSHRNPVKEVANTYRRR